MDLKEYLKYQLQQDQKKYNDPFLDKRMRKASKGNIKRLQKAIDNLKD